MYLAQAASGGEDPSVAPGGRPGLPEAASPLTPSRLPPAHSDFDSFHSAHLLSDFAFFSPDQFHSPLTAGAICWTLVFGCQWPPIV